MTDRSYVEQIRPPITYFGGKTRIARAIVDLLPAHEHYVEPFGGSLAVLLAKRPSAMETVNDINRALMTFWRVLRDRPGELERACALTPHSRAEHGLTNIKGPMPTAECLLCRFPIWPADESADGTALVWRSQEHGIVCPTSHGSSVRPHLPAELDEIEVARRLWVKLTQGRGSHTDRPTGWRYYQDARGSHASMPEYLDAYTARIGPVAARLHSVSLECRPALEVAQMYGKHTGCLIYADPPYPGLSRWGSDRRYEHEMLGEHEHRELAGVLRSLPCAVVVSGYPGLYDELLDGWSRREIDASAGVGNGEERARTEVVWSNREFPVEQTALFDE